MGKLRWKAFLVLCGLILISTQTTFGWAGQSYKPPLGFVPDANTACKIAEAILEPIYGKAKILAERPFTAVLHGGVWLVKGTLHTKGHGGVARVQISKADGRILGAIHGR
jgi:hypothetical protein